MLKVRIVKIHPLEKVDEEATEKKSDGSCDSPSSDKENSSQIAQDHQKKEAVGKEEEGRRESISMYDTVFPHWAMLLCLFYYAQIFFEFSSNSVCNWILLLDRRAFVCLCFGKHTYTVTQDLNLLSQLRDLEVISSSCLEICVHISSYSRWERRFAFFFSLSWNYLYRLGSGVIWVGGINSNPCFFFTLQASAMVLRYFLLSVICNSHSFSDGNCQNSEALWCLKVGTWRPNIMFWKLKNWDITHWENYLSSEVFLPPFKKICVS